MHIIIDMYTYSFAFKHVNDKRNLILNSEGPNALNSPQKKRLWISLQCAYLHIVSILNVKLYACDYKLFITIYIFIQYMAKVLTLKGPKFQEL